MRTVLAGTKYVDSIGRTVVFLEDSVVGKPAWFKIIDGGKEDYSYRSVITDDIIELEIKNDEAKANGTDAD
jgi:hypothetical protein